MSQLVDRIQPQSSAVIVIDMQNDFCHPEGALGSQGIDMTSIVEMAPKLVTFLDAVREANVPIIHIQTIHHPYTNSQAWSSRAVSGSVCKPNSWGAEFYEIVPRPEEIVIPKHRYSAFTHTPLESVLHTLNIKNVLLTGVNTNVCVDSTARDAYMRDYFVTVIADLTETLTPGVKEATLRTLREFFGMVVNASEIEQAWKNQ